MNIEGRSWSEPGEVFSSSALIVVVCLGLSSLMFLLRVMFVCALLSFQVLRLC